MYLVFFFEVSDYQPFLLIFILIYLLLISILSVTIHCTVLIYMYLAFFFNIYNTYEVL